MNRRHFLAGLLATAAVPAVMAGTGQVRTLPDFVTPGLDVQVFVPNRYYFMNNTGLVQWGNAAADTWATDNQGA